jgi:glutamate-1-semialdehyde 2,1-aminomutase
MVKKNLKILAIVQARIGSSRLPGKVLKKINAHSMISVLLSRLSLSKTINEIIVATSNMPQDFALIEHVRGLGYQSYAGDETDVLGRFLESAESYNGDIIVRITGDCPLVSHDLVDRVVLKFLEGNSEYASNISPPSFPDGLDVEVFSIESLRLAAKRAQSSFDREHVTPFIRNYYSKHLINVKNSKDYSNLRWTVDEAQDLDVVRNIFNYFAPNIFFDWKEVLSLYNRDPELFKANTSISRNEGAYMSNGQKMWKRAKHVIPGGTMLLSKRPELFLPEKWPAYYKSAKGCMVKDLDGNTYTDVSIMGIGTNILGYGNKQVDAAVLDAISNGNMSTLNCHEEVILAEKLVDMHPWADMVRFARTGGEANAIAIRIARASSGKDNVAVCGYHGWHDWYLSVNLGDTKGLDGHLLPGLEPNGVPRNLKSTVHPFEYGNFLALKQMVDDEDIGTIKMEVSRSSEPDIEFLKKVRQLANDKNIILIFDECTSGFRQSFGGIHLLTGVNPDIAMFGKAMGNGYAVTAVVGRREIMEAAQSSFISSTFWTERIGSVAALKSLEIMEETQSWKTITNQGNKIKKMWQKLADTNQLNINHWGLPSLAGFTFDSKNALEYKTLITQEMLKKGFLAGNSVYVSVEHTDEIIENYFAVLSNIFQLVKECEDGRDILSLLESPVCHEGFKRLN